MIVSKRETIASASARIILLHGIGQATNAAHDRNTAISHGDQLTKATGLKTRWHQKHVTAGIDGLGQFSIEGKKNGNLFRVTGCQVLEHLVIVLVANAQDD